jgi:hypothetical protein
MHITNKYPIKEWLVLEDVTIVQRDESTDQATQPSRQTPAPSKSVNPLQVPMTASKSDCTDQVKTGSLMTLSCAAGGWITEKSSNASDA